MEDTGVELYVKIKGYSKRDEEIAPKNSQRKEAGKTRKEEQIACNLSYGMGSSPLPLRGPRTFFFLRSPMPPRRVALMGSAQAQD